MSKIRHFLYTRPLESMKLTAYCTNCKKPIRFSARASDRVKLADKLGENIELTCNSCGTRTNYHVNRIHAVHNRLIGVLGMLVLIPGTLAMLYFWAPYVLHSFYAYSIIIVPGLIFFAISKSQGDKIRIFNSYRLP